MTASVSTIRRATPTDAPHVAAMVREIAAHEDQAGQVHVRDQHWRHLLDRPDVVVLLAERDGEAVGYVSAVRQLHLWTGSDVLDLDDLYVRPGHRDGGVGRQLMAALAALAAPRRLAPGRVRRPGRRPLTRPWTRRFSRSDPVR